MKVRLPFFQKKEKIKEPKYSLCPIEFTDPKTKEPRYLEINYNQKTGEYSVPVKELNPILVLRNPKTGEIEEIKYNEFIKKISKEQKIRIDEELMISQNRENQKSGALPTIKFKKWEDVKELFDERSQIEIEKMLPNFGKNK